MRVLYTILLTILLMTCSVSVTTNAHAESTEQTQYEELQQHDLTGDKVKETIKVTGTFYEPDSLNLKDITLQVNYGQSKKSISLPLGYGMKPVLHIVDLDHDGIKDVFISIKDIGNHSSAKGFGYSFKNEKVVNFEEIPQLDTQSTFQNDYVAKIKVSTKTYTVDVHSRKDMYEEMGLYHKGKLNEPMELLVGDYVDLMPTYTLKGKGIVTSQPVSGVSEDDVIGRIETVWILRNGSWQMKNVHFANLVNVNEPNLR